MKSENRLRLEWRDPRELEDNPMNFRRDSHAQKVTLRDAVDEVDWAGALLFNERTHHLIDGHKRKKIARKGEMVPVLIGSWSEEDERKILATFDAIGAMAVVDTAALEALLATVQFESPAIATMLENLAANSTDLNIRMGNDLEEPADHVEQAEELRKKWRTELGQFWKADHHCLACGDSNDADMITRLIATGDNKTLIDLILADAPYGVSYGQKTSWMAKHGAQRQRAPIANDSLKPAEVRRLFATSLKHAAAHARPGAAVYATVPSGSLLPHFIAGFNDSGFTFKHALIWLKNSMVLGRSDYNFRHETVLYGWREDGPHYFIADRKQDSIFEIDRPVASPFHPTTKPIQLMAKMIMNSSRRNDLIFDPFCGSGTTVLAGAQLNRKVFAVELMPEYVAVTLERLAALGLRPRLINR